MLDLETLGTEPGCQIISIGAVSFNNVELESSFTRNIKPQEGFTTDPETVMWWFQQPNCNQFDNQQKLFDVLIDFANWLPSDALVWGNAASFDNAILRKAYEIMGLKTPWSFRNDRCFRTVKNLFPVEYAYTGELHNALDDAVNQMQHLLLINSARNFL
jgi:hypothetical protein